MPEWRNGRACWRIWRGICAHNASPRPQAATRPQTVIPAKAGISCGAFPAPSPEIPTSVGMTGKACRGGISGDAHEKLFVHAETRRRRWFAQRRRERREVRRRAWGALHHKVSTIPAADAAPGPAASRPPLSSLRLCANKNLRASASPRENRKFAGERLGRHFDPRWSTRPQTVIPAKAGISCGAFPAPSPEIPTSVGMTADGRGRAQAHFYPRHKKFTQ